MRSSGSTPSRPTERTIPLLLLLYGEDHPKACTGRRLVRRGLVRSVGRVGEVGPRPVVLDPHADRPLSVSDLEAARSGGLLAVDCSWNRLADRGRLPSGGIRRRGIARRLPLLIAANPQHFGRVSELNTVEALAAALYVLGEAGRARELLGGFRGGSGFLDLSRERLELYRSASGAEEVFAAERRLFGGATATAASAAVVPRRPTREESGARSVR